MSLSLQQMLNPGGAVSPKRNPMAELFGGGSSSVGATGGGPPKLNFLAQLTARVKSSSNSAGEGAEDRNSAEGPSSAQQAPKSIATQAKSLFADIARFRKSEDSEVAVVAVANNASASAEDKENSAHTNTPATGKYVIYYYEYLMYGKLIYFG